MTKKIDFQENKQINFKDFALGTWDTLRLRLKHSHLNTGSGFPILAGLISIFPEKVNFQNMQDQVKYKTVNAVAAIATYVNDYVDMNRYL